MCVFFFFFLPLPFIVSQSAGDLFSPEENTNCYNDVKCYICTWLNNCSFQLYLLL